MLRLFEKTMLFVFATMVLLSCGKEYSYEGGIVRLPVDSTDHSGVDVKNEWRFTESTSRFSGPVDTAYLTQEGIAAVLTITGKSVNGNQNIFIKLKDISGKIQEGKTYKTTLDEVKFLYKGQADTVYSAIPYKGGDLYVTISEYDTTKIVGTFVGLVKDKQLRSLTVTDGYFSSPLRKAGPAERKGYAMLWANELCNGPIKVKVNDIEGKIDKSFYSAPDCEELGNATYKLSPGIYDWVAYCGKDSTIGKIEVKANDCAKVQIIFPIKPAPVTNTQKELACKISELMFNSDLANEENKKFNHVVAEYQGRDINILKYYVSPVPIIFQHSIEYAPNTIIIDSGKDFEKTIRVDEKGKIIEYLGSGNPSSIYPLEPPVLIKYYYDDLEQLVKREVYDAKYKHLKSENIFTWEQGNIVTAIENYPLLNLSKQTIYDYFDKGVKSMPFIDFDALEILLLQPLFHYGRTLRQIPKSKKVSSLGKTSTYDYDSYVIDDNGYVLSCRLYFYTGKKTVLNFSYQCF